MVVLEGLADGFSVDFYRLLRTISLSHRMTDVVESLVDNLIAQRCRLIAVVRRRAAREQAKHRHVQ